MGGGLSAFDRSRIRKTRRLLRDVPAGFYFKTKEFTDYVTVNDLIFKIKDHESWTKSFLVEGQVVEHDSPWNADSAVYLIDGAMHLDDTGCVCKATIEGSTEENEEILSLSLDGMQQPELLIAISEVVKGENDENDLQSRRVYTARILVGNSNSDIEEVEDNGDSESDTDGEEDEEVDGVVDEMIAVKDHAAVLKSVTPSWHDMKIYHATDNSLVEGDNVVIRAQLTWNTLSRVEEQGKTFQDIDDNDDDMSTQNVVKDKNRLFSSKLSFRTLSLAIAAYPDLTANDFSSIRPFLFRQDIGLGHDCAFEYSHWNKNNVAAENPLASPLVTNLYSSQLTDKWKSVEAILQSYQHIHFVGYDDKRTSGRMFLSHSDCKTEVIIAFCGTADQGDVEADVNVIPKRWKHKKHLNPELKKMKPRYQIRVHRGAYRQHKRLRKLCLPILEGLMDSGLVKNITIVGHSLGGGLAALMTVYITERWLSLPQFSHVQTTLATFGSMNVGNQAFKDWYYDIFLTRPQSTAFHTVNYRDPVPALLSRMYPNIGERLVIVPKKKYDFFLGGIQQHTTPEYIESLFGQYENGPHSEFIKKVREQLT